MVRIKRLVAAVAIICFTMIGGAAMAVNLGDLIGVVGGGVLVSNFSSQINDFINTVDRKSVV